VLPQDVQQVVGDGDGAGIEGLGMYPLALSARRLLRLAPLAVMVVWAAVNGQLLPLWPRLGWKESMHERHRNPLGV